jgi:hypothetical protein
MTEKKLTKRLQCIIVRGDIQIWVEKDRADVLRQRLNQPNCPQFIEYEERMINRADIVGVYEAVDLEEQTRRRNGNWKCKEGNWHDRGEKCECASREVIEQNKKIAERVAKCTKCKGTGWISTAENTSAKCSCITDPI